MNYGKFFRLNRSLSKIEEGIAIYDYVDLPAYFTPSVENHLSPKYPISVNITSTSVSFRLHYCAYKIEGQKDNLENYTCYTYDSDDFKIKNKDKYQSGDDIKVAHMEEVILELPFIENATSVLSDIIKDIYITNFPQMIGGSTSTGGRFLEQLINKRYPKSSEWKSIEKLKKEGDTEALLYGTLREASDDSPSYSTLWLMDLIKDVEGEKDKKRIDLYNKEDGSVVAFLRKLLLDFMFDLKHSDIFQNSANYQQMYSGLMSDFFFSALMHKCEYYYYRKLTKQAIEKAGKKDRDRITELYASELNKAETQWINDIMSLQAEKHFEHHNRANKWYQELFGHNSFACWPSWFAEPEEEMRRVCFTMIEKTKGNKIEHVCNTETLVDLLGLERQSSKKALAVKMIKSRDELLERISKWFLKRYDFNDVIHLHIAKHLNFIIFVFVFCFLIYLFGAYNELLSLVSFLDSSSFRPAMIFTLIISFAIILFYDFWREYNYHNHCGFTGKSMRVLQILRLMLQEKKWVYVSWVSLVVGLILLLFYWQGFWQQANSFWLSFAHLKCWSVIADFICNMGSQICSLVISVIILLVLLFYWIRGLCIFKSNKSKLSVVRKVITIKKLFGCLFVISLFFCAYLYYPIIGKSRVFSALIVFFVVFYSNQWFGIMPTIHPISSLHLLFPRLVAAITAGWLTMSLGFDIYVSFFDSIPRWSTAIAISGVVFIFIMYEISRIMPASNVIRKIFRSFEFLIISYCISLLVGVVVINFVGEKFLERGGYIGDYYEQHVDNNKRVVDTIAYNSNANGEILNDSQWVTYGKAVINRLNDIKDPNDIPDIKKVENLQEVTKDGHKIVEKKNILGFEIYFMRDFLIMFSFIAMFWGIFIQMIFTGEKQMTEL